MAISQPHPLLGAVQESQGRRTRSGDVHAWYARGRAPAGTRTW
ncbi:hypothetical protein SSPS47_00435 [Streptomyces sp. S4.7]|nr:hypothetical protein SSPS47_00435 [Streptomyces sp. S4.7]